METCQWSLEGERMNDRNGTLTITSLKESDSGSYVCEAKLPLYNIDATTVLKVTGQYVRDVPL